MWNELGRWSFIART